MSMFPFMPKLKSKVTPKMTQSGTKKHSQTVITKMPLVESNACKGVVLEPLILVKFTIMLNSTFHVTSERLY